jgi:hypothetical protein
LVDVFTAQRPTLREVLEHPFFTSGTMPPSIPSTAHDLVPVWHNLTAAESRKNLLDTREAALLGEQAEEAEEETPEPAEPAPSAAPAATVAQQEREFQKAVQPGSPISVLLQSAQQPLLVAPRDNENLIKRLTASRERDMGVLVGAKRANAGLSSIPEGGNGGEKISRSIKTQAKDSDRVTAVENQKARIVAQMSATLPSTSPDPDDLKRSRQIKKALQTSSSGSRVVAGGSGNHGTVEGNWY